MKQQKLSIVLFDMDGTLTEARRPIGMPMIKALRELFDQNEKAHIGVVTGSDLVYVKEQMKPLFEKDYNLAREIHWLPCNGTKYYKFGTAEWEVINSVDMEAHLGQHEFKNLMRTITEQQCHISELNIPLTGHFINYRGSMINWCPIGRNANTKHRKQFESIDNSNGDITLREQYLRRLKAKIRNNNIVCKLGGDTSFDIYPKGWDKTYCLKFFQNYNVYFVGDRCYENGNDYEIFQKLNPNSWATTKPSQTIQIIKHNIMPLLG